MPTTNIDSMQTYHTGAASDLAAQADPDASLGSWMSSTRSHQLDWIVINPISNVTIVAVSGNNGVGTGVITATATGSLAWTAPSSATAGTAVAIANGQTKTLKDGADTTKYIIVTRTSTADLQGAMGVKLVDIYENATSGDRWTGAEQAAGDDEYRAVGFQVTSGEKVGRPEFWITAGISGGATDVEIGVEEVAAAAQFKVIADEDTAPSGITFSSPTTQATALQASGVISSSEQLALWVHTQVTAGVAATPNLLITINYAFRDVKGYGSCGYGSGGYGSGVELTASHTGTLRGRTRIADTTLSKYGLWFSAGSEPDLTAAPDETFASLPFTTTTTATASTVHRLVVRERNEYGIWSQNVHSWKLETDGSFAQVSQVPSDPVNITVVPGAAGTAIIEATYRRSLDLAGNQADTWALYWTIDGSSPTTGGTADATETMKFEGEVAYLKYTKAAMADGVTFKVIVLARNTMPTPDLDSADETIYTTTADTDGPATPSPASLFYGTLASED